jgi:hypothetical protein
LFWLGFWLVFLAGLVWFGTGATWLLTKCPAGVFEGKNAKMFLAFWLVWCLLVALGGVCMAIWPSLL